LRARTHRVEHARVQGGGKGELNHLLMVFVQSLSAS